MVLSALPWRLIASSFPDSSISCVFANVNRRSLTLPSMSFWSFSIAYFTSLHFIYLFLPLFLLTSIESKVTYLVAGWSQQACKSFSGEITLGSIGFVVNYTIKVAILKEKVIPKWHFFSFRQQKGNVNIRYSPKFQVPKGFLSLWNPWSK